MSGAPILTVESLSGGYGEINVVEDVSLSIEPGHVLAIVGRNGVGKTTLMKLIAGHLAPTRGTIAMRGARIDALPPHLRHRQGLAYAPQENVAFPALTVAENLTLHLNERSLNRYNDLLAAFPRITQRLNQRAGNLSGGERKILSFCRALGEAQPLTLLDEPTEGVQAENIDKMASFITQRAANGAAFVIVEQNLGLVAAIADQTLVMDHGACVESHRGRVSRETLAERLAL
jgi:ABC-type branched-subunit amino acid transport system ATPase component